MSPSRIVETDYKMFWRKFRNSPELVATISIPVTDIVGDRPQWTDVNGNQLTKLELARANKFWKDNRGKETLKAMLFDGFLTGDGYLWKGKASKKEVMRALKEVMNKYKDHFNSLEMKELESKISQDEDVKKTKKLDYVPSSSMSIIYDNFDIYGYQQIANGIVSEFSIDEIIHFRYLKLDGKVHGFSPVEALSAEIFLLTTIKQNIGLFILGLMR
jgi:hypothetical protein